MSEPREKARRALARMLANGPLTALPKRPSDQALLAVLAAARFDANGSYREEEVNERLKGWLETFCAPFGIDHVTLRRLLVDSRLLARTASGSTYRLNAERIAEIEAVKPLDPARVLEESLRERDLRKTRHAPSEGDS